MIRHVIHLPRGLGRTEHLVDLVKKHNGVLVTHSIGMAEHLRLCYGLREDQVCSYRQLPHWLRGRERRNLYIDDADWILSDLLGVGDIDGVTMSTPDREDLRMGYYNLPPLKKEQLDTIREDLQKPTPILVPELFLGVGRPLNPEEEKAFEGAVQKHYGKKKGVLKKISKKGRGSKTRKARRGSKTFREDTPINEIGGFTPRKKVTKLKKARFSEVNEMGTL